MWIHFERASRYHAVAAIRDGRYTTVCGRTTDPRGQPLSASNTQGAEHPPARCACCMSRTRRPYLLPAWISALANPTADKMSEA
jgi:hypothetical protein